MPEEAAPSSLPRRRFVPEPVETTRSSKRQQQTKSTAQHVEKAEDISMLGEKEPEILVTPETPAADPPKRRFAPEPVETSTRSSRKKFTPEPVETSTRSSKDTKKDDDRTEKPTSRRKFLPEPVETTSTSTRRRRKVPEPEEEDERRPSHADSDLSRSSSTTSSSSRKFKPEVIEVARGSYRKGRSSSGHSSPPKSHLPSPPESPETSKAELTEPYESRFSAAALAKRHHKERQPSFHIPDLPIIESDSDDEEYIPELSDVSSSASDTDQSSAPKGPTYHAIDRKPVNVHERAPPTTDKELNNRILAAYINERPYEPVDHFAVEDEEDPIQGKLSGINGIDIKTFRRDSGTEHDWELQNMQKHHEQLEKMKADLKKDTAGSSRYSAAALAARHHGIGNKDKQKAKDNELKKMRTAASPPMLGDDLVFPQSVSPKMTRCDVDQIPRPRTDDDDEEFEVEGDPMLWQTNSNVSVVSNTGLWGGLCHKQDGTSVSRPVTPLRSGLQTPMVEGGNPFESPRPRTPGSKTPRRHKANFSNSHFMPLTPPRDLGGEDPFITSIDRKLNMEREFDIQFPAAVITQIYNYLSLGYPVLAHSFDEELSKISRIAVHELRKDDDAVDAKGHVGVPGRDGDEDCVGGGRCKRWEALRLYCKEWWRQSPQMVEKGPADWGSHNRLRRGSWNR